MKLTAALPVDLNRLVPVRTDSNPAWQRWYIAGFCFVLAVGIFLRLPSSLFSDPTSCFHRPESLHPQAGFSDNAEVNSALGELRQVQSKPGEAKQFYAATLTIDPIITGH